MTPSSKSVKLKENQVTDLADRIKAARSLMVVSIASLPSKQFHSIKKAIREHAGVQVAKKNIMIRAIKKVGEDKKGILDLENHVSADCAFVISDLDGYELAGILASKKTPAYAKAGQIAPGEIEVKEGRGTKKKAKEVPTKKEEAKKVEEKPTEVKEESKPEAPKEEKPAEEAPKEEAKPEVKEESEPQAEEKKEEPATETPVDIDAQEKKEAEEVKELEEGGAEKLVEETKPEEGGESSEGLEGGKIEREEKEVEKEIKEDAHDIFNRTKSYLNLQKFK